MDKKELLKNYNNKVLAIENFGINKELFVDNFIDSEKLLYRLYELDCHEISLTDDGLNFIKEYYSLDNVIDLILNEIKNGVDYKYSNKVDIVNWLERKGGIEI